MPFRISIARVLAVLAVMAVAVPLAACGGSDGPSKDDYKNESKKIATKLKSDITTAQQNLTSGDQAKILTGLNQFKSSLTEAKTGFEGLDVPADYKAVHDKLVGELTTVEGDVQGVTDAFQAQDQAKAQEAAAKLQSDVQGLQQAGNEFDKKVGT